MQVTIYMNLFVPVLCMVAAMFLPALRRADGTERPRVSWNLQAQIGLLLLANVVFFSVMGGAVSGAISSAALSADFAALRIDLETTC